MKIAGVVVLYNPDDSVVLNINSYIKDIELLYVFDNSEVKTNLIEEIKKINKVKYFSVGKNMGIGYALNYVCDIAVREGYDWILIMDQDSCFEPNGVLKMTSEFEKNIGLDKEKIGVISPLIVYEGDKMEDEGNGNFRKIPIAINSGSLLNLKAFLNAGKFREDYFLDRIDFEYSLRLKKFGYELLRHCGSRLYHKLGNLKVYNFLGFKIRVTNHNPIRHYYMTKNAIDIVKNYFKYFPFHCIYEMKSIVFDLCKVVLFEKDKFKKIKMIFKGIFDSQFNFIKFTKEDL